MLSSKPLNFILKAVFILFMLAGFTMIPFNGELYAVDDLNNSLSGGGSPANQTKSCPSNDAKTVTDSLAGASGERAQKQPFVQLGAASRYNSSYITVGNQYYELDSFGFYDANLHSYNEENIAYQDRFTVSKTTYINWEMWLHRPPGQDNSENTLQFEEYWYDETGELVYQDKWTNTFRPGREYDWFYGGCGYKQPGKWQAGTYQVQIYVNQQLAQKDSFTVVDDSAITITVGNQILRQDLFAFYDSSVYSPDSSEIEYREEFPLSKTTFINWEMWLSRTACNQPLQFTISEDWYGPDGQKLHSSSFPAHMETNWKSAYYYSRYGFQTAGRWPAGTYRVDIQIDGRPLCSACFKIVNDSELIIPVQGISLNERQLFLVAGAEARLSATVEPANATHSSLEWKSTVPGVATVDQNGLVKAGSAGDTIIVVSTMDNKISAQCQLHVSPPVQNTAVYRALLVGNSDYADSENDLSGPPYDLERIGTILANSRFLPEGKSFSSIKKTENLTRQQLALEIRNAFTGAKSSDISYFYYSGHGSAGRYGNGPYLCTVDADNEWMGVHELESILSNIPGTKVIILDCCFSGGMIGRSLNQFPKSDELTQFNTGVTAAFTPIAANISSKSLLTSSQYKVITAASGSQPSYEGVYNGLRGGEFTIALALGCGYKNEYLADLNMDRQVSLYEAYQYAKNNVRGSQVQVYPLDDNAFSFVGYAAAAEDTPVKSVQINKEHLVLKVDQSETLVATVLPANARNKNIRWESSNLDVATVSTSGTVHALKKGTADIKVTTEDGNLTANCQLVVDDSGTSTDWVNLPASPVKADKQWSITFNLPIDETSILEKNIYITDKDGSLVPQLYFMERIGDRRKVTLVPVCNYTPGSTYCLWIQNVRSFNNKILKNKIRMPFIIS